MTNADPWKTSLPGLELGGHRLESSIGSGNFGYVFEAVNLRTGNRTAIKVLRPGAQSEASLDFENETILLQQLSGCAGVINFITSGKQSILFKGPGGIELPIDVHFHVTALASDSLDSLVEDPAIRNSMSPVEKVRLWRSMIKALMQMHRHEVAHRDLKSSNCLLLVIQNKTVVKFADLGRSKDLALPTTRPAEAYLHGRGDYRFAPPESILYQGGSGKDDFLNADYYGLGSLFVELVTGQSISSLALGNIESMLRIGIEDYRAGRRTDLTALKPRYKGAIAQSVALLPKSIQDDATVVITSLCQPDPAERLNGSPFSRDRATRDKLAWILRRADIMIRRLEIEERTLRRRERISA